MPKTHTKTHQKKNSTIPWVIVAAVVLIAVAVIALPQILNRDAGLPLAVSVDQAADLRDAGAFVLDVRQPEEWTQAHIPGATLIPLGELQGRLSEVPKDQEILVYCRSGNRSQEGRDILLAAGYQNVTSMSGGINDWISQGYPTVSGP